MLYSFISLLHDRTQIRQLRWMQLWNSKCRPSNSMQLQSRLEQMRSKRLRFRYQQTMPLLETKQGTFLNETSTTTKLTYFYIDSTTILFLTFFRSLVGLQFPTQRKKLNQKNFKCHPTWRQPFLNFQWMWYINKQKEKLSL